MKIFSLFFAVLLLALQGTLGKSYIKSKERQREDCDYGKPKTETEIDQMGPLDALNPPALENKGI